MSWRIELEYVKRTRRFHSDNRCSLSLSSTDSSLKKRNKYTMTRQIKTSYATKKNGKYGMSIFAKTRRSHRHHKLVKVRRSRYFLQQIRPYKWIIKLLGLLARNKPSLVCSQQRISKTLSVSSVRILRPPLCNRICRWHCHKCTCLQLLRATNLTSQHC